MKVNKIIEDITMNGMIIFGILMMGFIDVTVVRMPAETFYAILALSMIADIIINDFILYDEEESKK